MEKASKTKLFRWGECIAVMVIAAVLRCLYMAKPDIGGDECFSLFYAQYPPDVIVSALIQGDNPPLWELLLHYWIMIFGIGIVSLRALSLLFSVATVIPIFLTGERFIGRHAGTVASLLYTFNTFSIFLSHDGRVYSLVGMLAAWSLYLFLSLIDDTHRRRRHWIWLTVVNLLILYSHYLAVWVIVAESIVVLVHKDSRRSLWRGGLIHLAVLLVAFTPMLPVIWSRFLDSGLHGTWIPKSTGVVDLYNLLGSFTNGPATTGTVMILLASAAIWGLVRMVRGQGQFDHTARLTLLWVVPVGVSFALSFLVGFLLNRYFYFLMPTYMLALTAYVFSMPTRRSWPHYALSAILVLLFIATVKPDSSEVRYGGWKGDTQTVARQVLERCGDGNTQVIIAPHWIDKQLVYYFDSSHTAFATRGQVQEPVFEQYLTSLGWFYESSPSTVTSDRVLVVIEKWWGQNNIDQRLASQGYSRTSNEEYQQMAIITYTRKTPEE